MDMKYGGKNAGVGVQCGVGIKGTKHWENGNSIINKIYFKYNKM